MFLTQTPGTPATLLAERVGWTGSPSWFRENVSRLRPERRRLYPADRLVWAPGDAAQCDLWSRLGGYRRGWHDGTVAGAGARGRLFAVHHGADAADESDRRLADRDVAVDRTGSAGSRTG